MRFLLAIAGCLISNNLLAASVTSYASIEILEPAKISEESKFSFTDQGNEITLSQDDLDQAENASATYNMAGSTNNVLQIEVDSNADDSLAKPYISQYNSQQVNADTVLFESSGKNSKIVVNAKFRLGKQKESGFYPQDYNLSVNYE